MTILRRLGAEQRGFSLVELMTALSIGMVVLLAAWTIIDASVSAADQVSDRVNTTQRGRVAMERMTQQLRSQVCLPKDVTGTAVDDTSTALLAADNDSVTFYSDLGGESSLPEKRRLTYASGKIVADAWRPTGAAPNWVYPTSPTSTRTLATDVSPVLVNGQAQAVFGFFAFNSSDPPSPDLALNVPLNNFDLARTVRVQIAFQAKPERKRHDGVASTLEGTVFVRGARSSNFAKGEYGGPPLCT